MFKCILQRTSEFHGIQKPLKSKIESATLGEFIVLDGSRVIFNCISLENIGPSTDTPNKDKRIMPRIYHLEWTNTSVAVPKSYKNPREKNGRGIILTSKEIPNFKDRRILIHIGNYPQDTEGCILLGLYKSSKNGVINNSTLAVKEFYDLVERYGVENFSLEIREI